MQSTLRKHQMPQVWDELRRKINDAQPQLPPGSGVPMVKDDFADVYGMTFAISGPATAIKTLLITPIFTPRTGASERHR